MAALFYEAVKIYLCLCRHCSVILSRRCHYNFI